MREKIKVYFHDKVDTDEPPRLVGRNNFCICFYHTGNCEPISKGLAKIFEKWLELVPGEALAFMNTGWNSPTKFRKVTKKKIEKLKEMLDDDWAFWLKTIFFEIMGGEEVNENQNCPEYYLELIGDAEDQDSTRIVMSFPLDFPQTIGVQKIIEFTKDVASSVNFTSGFASPTLVLDAQGGRRNGVSFEDCAKEQLHHVLANHYGYDVMDNNMRLRKKCKGARWLTFLNSEAVEELGGDNVLRNKLIEGITLERVGDGFLIQAGEKPELGDAKNGIDLPLLQSVAKAIEPITCFSGREYASFFDPTLNPREATKKWERRFLDD